MRKRTGIMWAFLIIFTMATSAVFSASTMAVDGANPTMLISSQVSASGPALTVNKKLTEKAGSMEIDAKSAILIDAGTGTVLFEKNSHEKLPPASVTKVMTMLLVMEAVDAGKITLQDKVTISERAASMGGSQLFMEAGEQQSVETLMKGISIASANDFCDKPQLVVF